MLAMKIQKSSACTFHTSAHLMCAHFIDVRVYDVYTLRTVRWKERRVRERKKERCMRKCIVLMFTTTGKITC